MPHFFVRSYGKITLPQLLEYLATELRGLRELSVQIWLDIERGASNCRLAFEAPDDPTMDDPRISLEHIGGCIEARGCRYPDDRLNSQRFLDTGTGFDNRIRTSFRSIWDLSIPLNDDPALAPGVVSGMISIALQSRYATRRVSGEFVSEFRDMHGAVWIPPAPIAVEERWDGDTHIEAIVLPVPLGLIKKMHESVRQQMTREAGFRLPTAKHREQIPSNAKRKTMRQKSKNRPLTPSETKAWTLYQTIPTYTGVGRELGVSRQAATELIKRAIRKIEGHTSSSKSVRTKALPSGPRGDALV